MKKLYSYIVLLFLSIIAWVIYFSHWKNSIYHEELFAAISTVFFSSIAGIHVFYTSNKDSILLSIKSLFNGNEKVYVSFSYLLKIKLNGTNKYLMVRGNKLRHQYQPVGGVYKRFPSLAEKWNLWEASEARNDPKNSDDLRFYTKKKHLPEIRKWFYSGKNREVDVWREFCEELLEKEILPQDIFKTIRPEFMKSHEDTLIQRKGIDTRQFLIYNIFCIHLSPEQENALVSLHSTASMNEKYAFVDEADLDKELFTKNNTEYQLGFHARYLNNNNP